MLLFEINFMEDEFFFLFNNIFFVLIILEVRFVGYVGENVLYRGFVVIVNICISCSYIYLLI